MERPSTAKLVNYLRPNHELCVAFTNIIDLQGLSTVAYFFDVKNKYDDIEEITAVVFFIDGEPIIGGNYKQFEKYSARHLKSLLDFTKTKQDLNIR